MVRTVGEAAKSKTARAMGNAIKEQVIEQGLNFAVDAVRGKDKIEGENEEFRNRDVKKIGVKSFKPLKLSVSEKLKRDEEYGKMIQILFII